MTLSHGPCTKVPWTVWKAWINYSRRISSTCSSQWANDLWRGSNWDASALESKALDLCPNCLLQAGTLACLGWSKTSFPYLWNNVYLMSGLNRWLSRSLYHSAWYRIGAQGVVLKIIVSLLLLLFRRAELSVEGRRETGTLRTEWDLGNYLV